MNTRDLATDIAPAAMKGAAGAGAAAWNAATDQIAMSIAVGAVTLIYLVAELAYLFWKWRRNDELGGPVP